MATVHTALARIAGRNNTGATLPDSQPRQAETLASAGASAAGAIVATAGDIWSITPLGNVWVAFGAAPVAASGSGWLVPAGQTLERGAVAGEKCAIKDAT